MNLLDLFVKVSVDDQASGQMEGLSAGMIAKGQLIASGIQAAVTKAAEAIRQLVQGAVDAYAQYEQLAGGMQTFFGDASQTVISNAEGAYKTAGMSANQYMSTVTSFATTLVNSVAQQGKQSAAESEAAAAASSKAFSRSLSDQLDALKYAQQDEMDARREAQQEALDGIRESQEQEVKEFQKATNEKIKEINREYTERMKLIDEEEYQRLKSLQDQIDGLEQQGKAAKEQSEQRERDAKIAALKDKATNSMIIEEREAARKELSELETKYAEEDAQKARDKRIDQLKSEQKDVKDSAAEQRAQLREEQQNRVEDYREARAEELEELRKSHADELKAVQKLHADELKDLQRSQAEEMKAAQRHNEDLMAERKRAAASSNASDFVKASAEDQRRAAELADTAIRDMSDNANKTGVSMQSLQDAYRGFSRENFTMLDNLSLGYGGTRSEMERLLQDAESIKAKQGEVKDYSIDSFSDIVEAIHVVQTEMGISGLSYDELNQKIQDMSFSESELQKIVDDTSNSYSSTTEVLEALKNKTFDAKDAQSLLGTTAKEANGTIEGSMNQAKAAWDNWLTAIANPEMNLGDKTNELVNSVATAAGNIVPRIGEVISSLGATLTQQIPQLLAGVDWEGLQTSFAQKFGALATSMSQSIGSIDWGQVGETIRQGLSTALEFLTTFGSIFGEKMLPSILSGLGELLANAATWLHENYGQILDAVGEILTSIGKGIIDAIPSLLENAGTVLGEIANFLREAPLKVAEVLFDVLSELQIYLIENAPDILIGALKGIWEFVRTQIEGFPGFLETAGKLVGMLIGHITEMIPKLLGLGAEMMKGLLSGIENGNIDVSAFFRDLPVKILELLAGIGSWLLEAGGALLRGLLSGVGEKNPELVKFFEDLPGNLLKALGDIAVFLLNAGKDLLTGLWNGAKDIAEGVIEWFKNLPQNILNAIGDVGRLLWDAGRSIIDGFWNGLKEAFENVKDWVGGIADWIRDNKGPRRYDLGLLVPNGEWIMQGLADGMRGAFPLIEDTVSDIAGLMSVGMPDISLASVGRSQQPLPPVNIYMTYNAGEDARELVTDMVGQLRRYGYTMGGKG